MSTKAAARAHRKSRDFSRRIFLSTGAAAAAALVSLPIFHKKKRHQFTGRILGANSSLGHRLRDNALPKISAQEKTRIAIIGGGIGGLAAARQLYRAGIHDFVLLELEGAAGGNASFGSNTVSAYPWGAHYVPLVGSDCTEVRILFQEVGIIKGTDTAGLAIYDEEYLCSDPMERLFIEGRWQEGFIPQVGNSATDQRRIESFLSEMHRLKLSRGSDGKRAFAIPVDLSSADEQFRSLDRITMAGFLRAKGWYDCQPLRWYVDYCCRDDYGAGIESVSAWAGVHYFASRDGKASNATDYSVVTWPEGNGWLVTRLREGLDRNIRTGCVAWNVSQQSDSLNVDFFDTRQNASVRLNAEAVVWAAPHFVARRVIEPLRNSDAPNPISYSPWMVANLTLKELPKGRGMDIAWDNVLYGSQSKSLGYVVATHQSLKPVPQQTVITYYKPLDHLDPASARQDALTRSHRSWYESIISDLAAAHPDIADDVLNLDVWLWGHGMVRPVPGFIWSGTRSRIAQPLGNIYFAHSDLSGISLFEEAYTRGVQAAKQAMESVGVNSQYRKT